MTATLSNGSDTFAATIRVGYASSNDSQTVLHRNLDGSISVSLRADLPRSGDLPLLFDDVADAHACRAALTLPAVWTLEDDLTEVEMTFVRSGRLSAVQQEDRSLWLLEVGYQEVET